MSAKNNTIQNTFFRFEFKYPVKKTLLPSIEDDLLRIGFEPDTWREKNAYPVSSVYFDTPALSDYFDKSGGFLKRKKARARIYTKDVETKRLDTPSVWLEIKEKHGMMIYKRRVCITPREWNALLISPVVAYKKSIYRLSDQEKAIFSEFVFLLIQENRGPYIAIQYERKALQHWDTDKPVRITLDYDITAEESKNFVKNPSSNVSRELGIIELKFKTAVPWHITFLLSKYSLRRDAYSKYAHGVDAVRKFYPIHR